MRAEEGELVSLRFLQSSHQICDLSVLLWIVVPVVFNCRNSPELWGINGMPTCLLGKQFNREKMSFLFAEVVFNSNTFVPLCDCTLSFLVYI